MSLLFSYVCADKYEAIVVNFINVHLEFLCIGDYFLVIKIANVELYFLYHEQKLKSNEVIIL